MALAELQQEADLEESDDDDEKGLRQSLSLDLHCWLGDDSIVSCVSIDLGERALGIVQLLFDKHTHRRQVIAAHLIDVTQKQSRQVDFVIKRAMHLFHEAYDRSDISTIDFVLIEEQPDINKQMSPLAFTLREYFETLKRLNPKQGRYPIAQSVRFIHASLKLKLCYDVGAHKQIKPADQWSSTHEYNKQLSNAAGAIICRTEERALIEKYKRTHDLYDCVLQAEQFLRLVFAHTKDGRDNDSIRGHAIDFTNVPSCVGVSTSSGSGNSSSSSSIGTNKRKTAGGVRQTGNASKPKKAKGKTSAPARHKLTVAPAIPTVSCADLSLALLPTRFSIPLEQRTLLKAKRAKQKAKYDVGTLVP